MRDAPRGYVIADPSLWSKCYLTDTEIEALAESQLAKIGLKSERVWLEENGQEGFGF